MKPREILSRWTGFSTPIFGIQWNPPVLQMQIAKEVIIELEDRRVLFYAQHGEDLSYANQSAIQIRQMVNNELKKLDRDAPLYKSLSKLRKATRDFCNECDKIERASAEYPVTMSMLRSALEKFRKSVGQVVGEISVSFDLEIEDDLASIIPFNNISN